MRIADEVDALEVNGHKVLDLPGHHPLVAAWIALPFIYLIGSACCTSPCT